jgi:hypothetical protein
MRAVWKDIDFSVIAGVENPLSRLTSVFQACPRAGIRV